MPACRQRDADAVTADRATQRGGVRRRYGDEQPGDENDQPHAAHTALATQQVRRIDHGSSHRYAGRRHQAPRRSLFDGCRLGEVGSDPCTRRAASNPRSERIAFVGPGRRKHALHGDRDL